MLRGKFFPTVLIAEAKMSTPVRPVRTPEKNARDLLVFVGLFNIYFAMFFLRDPDPLIKIIPAVEYLWLAGLLFKLKSSPLARKLIWPTALVFLGPIWMALAKGWVFGVS